MDDPLRIAVCEDDPKDAALLIKLIEDSGIPAICNFYDNAQAFLAAFVPGSLDLIFFDIYMQGLSGMEAAGEVRRKDEDIVIAFATSSQSHALESYRLGALKYLEKPFALQAVIETIKIAALKKKTKKTVSLLIGGKAVELVMDSILFFEMDAAVHAVQIHLYGQTLRASQTLGLNDIESLLPKKQFLRCHRGYIVNLRRVRGFSGADCIMENGEKAFVRLKDAKKVKRAYDEFMLALVRGEAI